LWGSQYLAREHGSRFEQAVDKVARKQVFEAGDKLNSRPSKCLGFKTPYEAFEELTGVDIKKI
jgi:IS30 family transposase